MKSQFSEADETYANFYNKDVLGENQAGFLHFFQKYQKTVKEFILK